MAKGHWVPKVIGLAVLLCVGLGVMSCKDKPPVLQATPGRTEGTAVYILLDVSGSMGDSVKNADNVDEQKLRIAKRAAIDVCNAIDRYAVEDLSRKIVVEVADFSDDVTVLFPMGKPDVPRMEQAINAMQTIGGTAIGDAVKQAQEKLDKTGLKHQHILILTDGENNGGIKPEAVAQAINNLPEEARPRVYVVAFDVNASVFDKVKQQGWQVYSAKDGKQLKQQLDEVVGGHILIEQ